MHNRKMKKRYFDFFGRIDKATPAPIDAINAAGKINLNGKSKGRYLTVDFHICEETSSIRKIFIAKEINRYIVNDL